MNEWNDTLVAMLRPASLHVRLDMTLLAAFGSDKQVGTARVEEYSQSNSYIDIAYLLCSDINCRIVWHVHTRTRASRTSNGHTCSLWV